MAENSAFANLKLNCPKNPPKEEQIVLERTLAKKEDFDFGRISEKTLGENLEKLTRIVDLNNWLDENKDLPENSTIVTSAELAEIMQLMTKKSKDQNAAVSDAEMRKFRTLNLCLEKILALPENVEIFE